MKREFIAVYILSNKYNGTVYTGVTSDLPRRIWQHRSALIEGFSKRYGLNKIVYYEPYTLITKAIVREKQIKGLNRVKRIKLIESINPKWEDLWLEINGCSIKKDRSVDPSQKEL
jgi:putative endonuclease